ncbi:hypothetical protein IKF74_01665 [Candidatus Saccharibacteria bacterium]|nr:hypothetical protein [Candidatus Saccharibacteria bacterium]
MTNSKTKKTIREPIIYSILAAIVLAGLILISNSTKVARPEVATPTLDGNLLTINATDTDHEYVYCVTQTENPDTCQWENSREFALEEEGKYFLYVKGISSGLVSTPRVFEYQKVDYTKLRI